MTLCVSANGSGSQRIKIDALAPQSGVTQAPAWVPTLFGWHVLPISGGNVVPLPDK
jgi:hypothetical protein